MKVDIWSDVRCPFCYIGKKKFEAALRKFPQRDKVKVNWRSFELDPHIETTPAVNVIDHLAAVKGISPAQAEGMHQYVTGVAREVGLDFNFEKSVVANSFNAHRLIQLAQKKGLAEKAEEELFKAQFIDGKNIDDKEILLKIGQTIGINEKEVEEMLNSDSFSREVKQDEIQARSLGINGVPFFLLDDKYAVSGAQSTDVFLQALERVWKESEKEKQLLILTEGESCTAGGNCN